MAKYTSVVEWSRDGAAFTDNRYSRGHRWLFDGGIEVPGSSSPHSVPLPYSSADAVDPEEAFVASIASCHMLWFLSIAAKRGFTVDSYDDDAEGFLERDADGRVAVTRVNLRPTISWSGERTPSTRDIAALHEEAHHACYIANSVKTAIAIETR